MLVVAAQPPTGLIELTADTFAAQLTSLSSTWVLIEFMAHWCPACRSFQPAYEEVALHLWQRRDRVPTISVVRVDCAENVNSVLCDEFAITAFPTMYLGSPVELLKRTNDGLTRVNPPKRTKEQVIAALEAVVGASLDISSGVEDKVPSPPQSNRQHLQYLKPLEVHLDLVDVEAATLQSWSAMTSPVLLKGEDARQAVEAWLDLLVESHPVDRCRQGAEIAETMLQKAWPKSAEAVLHPAMISDVAICGGAVFEGWSSCKGSSPDSRGYTCGLWQLFHSLAARLGENDSAAGATWLAAIKGFVKHFFQCGECAEHFMQYHGNSAAADAVMTKRDAVLWLWRTHNEVNARLAKEEELAGTTDVLYPKQQWPLPEMCKGCRTSDGEWDDDAIYSFLLKIYGVGDEVRASVWSTGSRLNGSHSRWTDAFLLCAGISAMVYIALRGSGQYAIRRNFSRTRW
jgi:thiol oxidase